MYENEYKDIDIAGHYNCVLTKNKEIIGEWLNDNTAKNEWIWKK